MNMLEKSVSMYGKTGVVTDDVVKTVDDVINYVGKEINFAMTLGLGKPAIFSHANQAGYPSGQSSKAALTPPAPAHQAAQAAYKTCRFKPRKEQCKQAKSKQLYAPAYPPRCC